MACSSWGDNRDIKEEVPAGVGHAVTSLIDDYILPGVPVMVLRTGFPKGTITTSMTTHWSAVALKLLSTHRPLFLRADSVVLTADNLLYPAAVVSEGEHWYAIYSGLYQFSVEYPGTRVITLTLYLPEGRVPLALSSLLSTVAAAGVWFLVFAL